MYEFINSNGLRILWNLENKLPHTVTVHDIFDDIIQQAITHFMCVVDSSEKAQSVKYLSSSFKGFAKTTIQNYLKYSYKTSCMGDDVLLSCDADNMVQAHNRL